MLGAGFSIVLSTSYSFVEQSMVVSDLIGGLLVCSGGTCIALYCLVCGSMVVQHPLILNWFNYGTLVVIVLGFGGFRWMGRSKLKPEN